MPVGVGTFFQTNFLVALPCRVFFTKRCDRTITGEYIMQPHSILLTHIQLASKSTSLDNFPLEQIAYCQLWKSLNHQTTLPCIFFKRLLLIWRGRVDSIVPACQPGWEEMENLRGNLGEFEENWEEIIQNEVSLGGSPTNKVILWAYFIFVNFGTLPYYLGMSKVHQKVRTFATK